jgi:2-oxo-4-hydroxy-4-carboxy-5-ureidoimidazoline decarboxylase
MKIAALNSLDRDGFVRFAGWLFEHSPWVAERAWSRRPFATIEAFHQALVEQVEAASRQEQLALLCAHPDLGTSARVSSASAAEQAGVGLDRLTPLEFEQLQSLNAEYRNKYEFPFVLAVRGSTKRDILRALARRLQNTPEEEYREALRQVYRIARFRIEDSIG